MSLILRTAKLILLILITVFYFSSCNQAVHKYTREDVTEGWMLNDDGSYSLKYKELTLSNCFPSVDGHAIHPLAIEVKRTDLGGTIVYKLKGGDLRLTLTKTEDSYLLKSSLTGFAIIPDWVLPMASAEVQGADRFYKQGFGFAGAGGIYPIPEPIIKSELAVLKENVWSYDSYLFTGLLSKGNSTMVISAYDHKNYQQRAALYNRQHRIGLIDRHLDTNPILFETGFALEQVPIKDQTITLPHLYFKTGTKPFETFRQQALDLAHFNNVKLTHTPRYYFCSWYEFEKEFSAKILADMLHGMDTMAVKPELQTIQLDDGFSWYGDWLKPNERYPEGIEASIKKIKDKGYGAGIWIGPFMVSSNSFIFKKHKDWLLKDINDNIIIKRNEELEQGYVLDSSHPEAFNYLRTVFRTFKQMGITTFKTDFMDWVCKILKQ